MGLVVLLILAATVLVVLGITVPGLAYLLTIGVIVTVLALGYSVARFLMPTRRRRG